MFNLIFYTFSSTKQSFSVLKKKSPGQLRREAKRKNDREQPEANVRVTENIFVHESTKVSDIDETEDAECQQCALRFKSDKSFKDSHWKSSQK